MCPNIGRAGLLIAGEGADKFSSGLVPNGARPIDGNLVSIGPNAGLVSCWEYVQDLLISFNAGEKTPVGMLGDSAVGLYINVDISSDVAVCVPSDEEPMPVCCPNR